MVSHKGFCSLDCHCQFSLKNWKHLIHYHTNKLSLLNRAETDLGGPVKKVVPESKTTLQIFSSEQNPVSTPPTLIYLQGKVQKSESYII